MVFAGLYPVIASDYEALRDALEKLRLNDSSLFYEPENSEALGFGFRCGFLGLLHMEIVQERLEREFNLDLITTAPSVRYRVTTKAGEVLDVHTPSKFPPAGDMDKVEEPVIRAQIFTQDEYLGGILKLLEEKRGVQKGFEYVSPKRVLLTYELPLNEIVLDFYDRLKSASRGYASLDYHFAGYWISDLVKVDFLVAGEPVDALSFVSHRDQAFTRGRVLCGKMRKLIPRQTLRSGASGFHRIKSDRARKRPAHAEERYRQVLRRRHLAQTQAARKAEGREEAHEARGSR